MSLNSALQIGRSALMANQVAMEVTGNNLANAASRTYHRQTIALEPAGAQEIGSGIFLGRGVQVQDILRRTNEALEGRLRTGISDESRSLARRDLLSQIESLHNELSDIDLSTRLGEFFNSWSELANTPLDNSLRTLVIRQGETVADFVRNLYSELSNLRVQVDRNIDFAVSSANDLLTKIAALNQQIATTERGQGGAHTLRDQRDALLGELSQYIDISTIEQPSGSLDVFVGSLPVILNGESRGIEVRRQTVNGQLTIDVVLSADGSVLNPQSGELGALIAGRKQDVDGSLTFLNDFANQLIYQVNRVHSQGQGKVGYTSVTGTNRVLDTTVALNDAASGLNFTPGHGSLQIHITQKSTGQRVTSTIQIDLDNVDTANNTSLTSLAASLNAVNNINATITGDGKLRISSGGDDFEVSFSDDTSGVLAALGINTFFSGKNATDIAVNETISSNPVFVAAGQGHISGDNRNALAMATLRNQSISVLGGLSLMETWNRSVEDYAIRAGQAEQQLQADSIVRSNLEAQRQSISGVNTDEEAINLLQFQRAFQASARFLVAVDELIQTVLGLI